MGRKKQYILEELHSVYSLMDRLCETTLLLEAMSLDDIYQKYYSNIERETFDKIVSADPTSGPNKKGKYTEWLLNLYKAGNLKMEDLYKATDYLDTFHKYKNRLRGIDIGQIKNLPELYDVVEPFMEDPDQATSKSDEVRKAKSGAEKVYEDEGWLILKPMTKEAAIYYGKGTQWCTAATSAYNYYDSYVEDYGEGCLYINIDKKNKRKYQFCFDSEEFMDERDQSLLSDDISIAEEIGLSEKVLSFYHGILGFDNWTYLAFPHYDDVQRYKFVDLYPDITYVASTNKLYKVKGNEVNKFFELPDGYFFSSYVYHGIAIEDYHNNVCDIFDVERNCLLFDHLKEEPLVPSKQKTLEFDGFDGYYVDSIDVFFRFPGLIRVYLYNKENDGCVYYDLKKREAISPMISSEYNGYTASDVYPVYWLENTNGIATGMSDRKVVLFRKYDREQSKYKYEILDCTTRKKLDVSLYKGGFSNNFLSFPVFNKGVSYLCFLSFRDENDKECFLLNDLTLVSIDDTLSRGRWAKLMSLLKKHPLDPEHQKIVVK